MHKCVGNLTTIGSDKGLSTGRRQTIIWPNSGILLIRPLWSNCSEILIEIDKFPFTKMHLNMPSAKWWPFGLGLNMLRQDIGSAYTSVHLIKIRTCWCFSSYFGMFPIYSNCILFELNYMTWFRVSYSSMTVVPAWISTWMDRATRNDKSFIT